MMSFSKELYPKIAVLKSAYAFTDRAYVHVDADDRCYLVSIKPKEGCEEVREDEFANEMLAQAVRHEVYKRTRNVRDLLLARAVASTVIDWSGAPAETEQEALDDSEEEILANWLETPHEAGSD